MTFAPDFEILAKAYAIPLRNAGAALRIFWPFLVIYEIAAQAILIMGSVPALASQFAWSFAAYVVLAVVAWRLFASGAVQWHRWLILNEQPARLRVRLTSGSRAYFWLIVLLALAGLVIVLVTAGTMMAFWPFEPFALAPDKVSNDMLLWTLMLPIIDVLVVIFFSSFVMLLPIYALEPFDTAKALRQTRPRPMRGWRLTLLLATVPLTSLWGLFNFWTSPPLTIATSDAVNSFTPSQVIRDCLQSLTVDVIYFYTALVFVSALSLWYAKYERTRMNSGQKPTLS